MLRPTLLSRFRGTYLSIGSVLMKMMSSSENEIASMESEFANPKNALGTVDGQEITNASATTTSGE